MKNWKVFVRSTELSSYTKNTITDPKTLIEVIQDVRKKGYAIDLQEITGRGSLYFCSRSGSHK